MGRSASGFERARSKESADDSLTDPHHEASSKSAARAVVLRRLTASARTRYELAEDLKDRGFPADVTAGVLDRFEEVGLVNDAEFAELWVATRHRNRGTARSVLRKELRSKGVSDELAESALTVISSEDELVRARKLIERKLISLRSASRDQSQRRLVAYLLRRGYQGGVAFAVVSQALDLHDVQMDG